MKETTVVDVEAMIKEGKSVHVIDVREVDEVTEGKIPGAMHIPLGLLEFRMHELDKEIEYTMVCRSGGRSGKATQLLANHGFKVVNMAGGMLAWQGPIK